MTHHRASSYFGCNAVGKVCDCHAKKRGRPAPPGTTSGKHSPAVSVSSIVSKVKCRERVKTWQKH